MTTEEKVAGLEARIARLEALLSKVVTLASASAFGRAFLKKVMDE